MNRSFMTDNQTLLVISIICWTGIFTYIFYLDRRVSKKIKQIRDDE